MRLPVLAFRAALFASSFAAQHFPSHEAVDSRSWDDWKVSATIVNSPTPTGAICTPVTTTLSETVTKEVTLCGGGTTHNTYVISTVTKTVTTEGTATVTSTVYLPGSSTPSNPSNDSTIVNEILTALFDYFNGSWIGELNQTIAESISNSLSLNISSSTLIAEIDASLRQTIREEFDAEFINLNNTITTVLNESISESFQALLIGDLNVSIDRSIQQSINTSLGFALNQSIESLILTGINATIDSSLSQYFNDSRFISELNSSISTTISTYLNESTENTNVTCNIDLSEDDMLFLNSSISNVLLASIDYQFTNESSPLGETIIGVITDQGVPWWAIVILVLVIVFGILGILGLIWLIFFKRVKSHKNGGGNSEGVPPQQTQYST